MVADPGLRPFGLALGYLPAPLWGFSADSAGVQTDRLFGTAIRNKYQARVVCDKLTGAQWR